MKREELALHFQRAALGVDVTRLRRFVLALAVRGKLVEQIETDEPATELVGRIRAEREQPSLNGRARAKATVAPPSLAEEPPYDIPASWAWVPLGYCIDSHLGGGTPSKSIPEYWDGDIWWASVKDVGKDKYIDRTIDRITEAGLADSSSNLVAPDSLIVVTRMGLGKVAINRVPLAINQDLRALVVSNCVSLDYCYMFFKTRDFEGTGLTVKGIKVDELLATPFPLPPYPEQLRIVARVEELMSLCDELEAAELRREEIRRRLVVTASRRLAHPPVTEQDALREDARFYLQNLWKLAGSQSDIDAMRDTILALAVEGRLVAPDDGVQPVAETLAAPAQLPSGYSRRRKILKNGSVNLPANLFPPLPPSWEYKTIQELYDLNVVIDYADGNHGSLYPRKSEFGTDGVTFVTAKDIVRDRVVWKSCARLRDDRAEHLTKGWARGGDVLLTHNATVGRVARVEEDAGTFLLGTSVTFYRLNDEFMLPDFFFFLLKSPLWQRQLQAVMVQTTRNQVSIQKQALFQVPVPPVEEQRRIVSMVEDVVALCNELENRLAAAERARGSLAVTVLDHLTRAA